MWMWMSIRQEWMEAKDSREDQDENEDEDDDDDDDDYDYGLLALLPRYSFGLRTFFWGVYTHTQQTAKTTTMESEKP